MIDMDMMITSSNIIWIKEFLDPAISAGWKNNLEVFAGVENLSLYLQSNFARTDISARLPDYYTKVIESWQSMKYDLHDDFANQLIWYNKNVKIGNKCVYGQRLFQCGMWIINDLYKDATIIPFEVWKSRGADYLTIFFGEELLALSENFRVYWRTET